MAVLTLKNVPEELVDRLKREARQNRRSLNQEAIFRLETSLGIPRRRVEDTETSLRRFHRRMATLPRLTDKFLNDAKGKGRR